MVKIEKADRIKDLPPYLFAKIDQMKGEMQKKGADIIDLGVGDPDLPTPAHIIDALQEAAGDPKNHRYPSYSGMIEFREAVAKWYQKRFHVSLNPSTEVISLIGSKEGIAHIPLAFINTNDIVLTPDPGYPVYNTATLFAGGNSYFMPLVKENHFIPDFSKIPDEILRKAKLMYLNYPNNPTAAVAERPFFEDAVKLAHHYQIIICHDAAYTEVCFDDYRPPSILEISGAMDIAIEFHSLSKTYNMTGWRIGFAVGNPDIIAALGQVKTNIDSGVAQAIQTAGITALLGDQTSLIEMRSTYQERRDLLVTGLKEAGFEVSTPKATFYLWVSIPFGFTSTEFTTHLLTKAAVVTTPGNGFGASGEGYIRMALTVDKDRIAEVVRRIKDMNF
ncbi:MAG: aminotransferase [Deltaproteobacteria bacterium DG_8]|nr:MAG: aminotransferase [Deltaproteobacteria bacterium DG_8]